jgi:Xaa-Pro dipeptidase
MGKLFEDRWKKIKVHLEDKKADAFIVKNPYNLRYLTCPEIRYTHEDKYPIQILIIPRSEEPIAITQYMDANTVRSRFPKLQILTYSGVPAPDIEKDAEKSEELIKKVLSEKKLGSLLCDETVANIKGEVDDFVESMRTIKDQHEIECIKTAQNITIKAAGEIKGILEEGKSELQVVNELEYNVRKLGAPFTYFNFIIASGENSAIGRYQPTERRIRRGDVVVCDFGAFYGGYGADVTRTYFMGKVSNEAAKAYQAVYESLQAGIDCVEEGAPYLKINKTCNDVLKKYGLQIFRWVSGTGHGIGMEVHERPKIGSDSTEVVKEGHVFAIEPGVYIPGKFGVRIEDNILVHKGVHNLTLIEKGLKEVIL